MLSPEDAWGRLLPFLAPLPIERVRRRNATGHVLARDLAATVDVPAHDVSAMDGYALAGELEPGARRRVTGVVAAGDPPGARIPPGAAVRIMTGAPVPADADRVVPVELTDDGDEEVAFLQGTGGGAHIRRRGEIVRRGAPILGAGSLLTPGALSLAATHGFESLSVHRAPRIACLVTGDEVVSPEREPAPGQLRDSHTAFLTAAVGSLGLEIEALGIVGDREEAIARGVERGLAADVLLVTGGVSMGTRDLVEPVLAAHGCRALFDSVAIQPGKPLVAAAHDAGLVFGLPGNPASVMVGFWLFVRPALRRLLGHADEYWGGALNGRLAAPLPAAKKRTRFLSAGVRFVDGVIEVTPAVNKGSHDLAAYACGTALVRIPAGSSPRSPGEPCEVLPLADWRATAPRD